MVNTVVRQCDHPANVYNARTALCCETPFMHPEEDNISMLIVDVRFATTFNFCKTHMYNAAENVYRISRVLVARCLYFLSSPM